MIEEVQLKHFMLFDRLKIRFSENINVISGENSTGKTALLKVLYACLKAVNEVQDDQEAGTRERMETAWIASLQSVFCFDDDQITQLGKRNATGAEIELLLAEEKKIKLCFDDRQENHLAIDDHLTGLRKMMEPIYLGTKEISSAMQNFSELYQNYQGKQGEKTDMEKKIMAHFEQLIGGQVIEKGKRFYLKTERDELEMNLVSEGYRKLVTLMYVLLSRNWHSDSVLFWDEPETNLNPKMIEPVIRILAILADSGAQIFIATHDYFVQQSLSMTDAYLSQGLLKKPLCVNFISLFQEHDRFQVECSHFLAGLKHNAIMEEFEALYDREQRLFYEN